MVFLSREFSHWLSRGKGSKSSLLPPSFGRPDASLQMFTCHYDDYDSLLEGLPSSHNPVHFWSKSTKSKPIGESVTTWFRRDHHVAFYAPPPSSSSDQPHRMPLTYYQLHQQIAKFTPYKIHHRERGSNAIHVVAVMLPPALMAETAVTLVTLLAQHKQSICVAPMDPNMPVAKLEDALLQLECTALVTTKELYKEKQLSKTKVDLQDVRFVRPSSHDMAPAGAVHWSYVKRERLRKANFPDLEAESAASGKPALLLRTSGTTAVPKIVPISREALLYNATCMAASLQIQPSDVGCNAMPLFHIGGISCGLLTVLVSGTSTVMMPGPFESQTILNALATPTQTTSVATNDGLGVTTYAQPTWYYGAPSMHKALLWTFKSNIAPEANNNNLKLRFLRSGAAHLPHETAVDMASTFQTTVYPTYGMSECLPITSTTDTPISAGEDGAVQQRPDNIPENTVGKPVGCSVAIVDADGRILPYGTEAGDEDTIGQVALKGVGVIDGYIGIPLEKSHTADGWFLTGDMGHLDKNGRLVLSGRQKEMIKRGGDQVWPNEIDGVVEKLPNVKMALTFGVPNELWGEEVHVAVVVADTSTMTNSHQLKELEQKIVQTCRDELGAASAPSKIHFVESADSLPKGSTGKFLRRKTAEHLGAKAADTVALNALKTLADWSNTTPTTLASDADDSNANNWDNSTTTHHRHDKKADASSALNGVRFITACFVIQYHVGLLPNPAWLKIQSYSLSMTMFMLLGAFQLATSVKSEVWGHAAQFVGTKIGSMHSLFLVSQVVALGSYLLMECGEGGYAQTFEETTCTAEFPYFLFNFAWSTLTGLGGLYNLVNPVAWFQSSFYLFLLFYPLLDKHLRSATGLRLRRRIFWINLLIASLLVGLIFFFFPDSHWFGYMFPSWLPALLCGMIAGYWFSEHSVVAEEQQSNKSRRILQRPKCWGVITDLLTVLMLFLVVVVANSPGCLSMTQENYQLARPDEEPIAEPFERHGHWHVYVCDLTHEEFVEYIHGNPDDLNDGRWWTWPARALGFGRVGTPLVLLWIFGLAYGEGLTARLMTTRPMQKLAPLAYPLYLLHLPICRYYWVLTRGHEAEFWWQDITGYPMPVEWYEIFVVIGICLGLAMVLDRFVVRLLTPYTIGWGVNVCKGLSQFGCFCCFGNGGDVSVGANLGGDSSRTLQQVAQMVQGLNGKSTRVERATLLQDLGLDSLGATALLGMLRNAVPTAKSLTMSQLSSCATVGDLVDILDNNTGRQEQASPV